MSDDTPFLDKVYDLDGLEKTQAFYREWARTYDAEVRANGYVSPERCAAALADLVGDKAAPLLDLGCGTGLSGEALREAGFTALDGTDFSAEMLAAAETKGIYRKLSQGDLNDPIPARPGEYATIAAIGVFSPGHAPAEMIDQVMALLPEGGLFVFTLNDHALAEKVYEDRMNARSAAGTVEIAFSEYGPHLKKRQMGSRVYVLRKR